MIKSLMRGVLAFGVLWCLYMGYQWGFERYALEIQPQMSTVSVDRLSGSSSARQATLLAEGAFGPRHWTTDPSRTTRYYSNAGGYWMYTQTYERTPDGKRIKFLPFAMIWRSKDDKGAMKTIVAEEAIIELDHAFDPKQGTQPTRIVLAKISGSVEIRDHKLTPLDPSDDLTIQMPYIEFNDRDGLIRSDRVVTMRDRNLAARGVGLLIELIKTPPPTDRESAAALNAGRSRGSYGYEGASKVVLAKDVHIYVTDIGNNEVLPGAARAQTGQGVPLDLRCAGSMTIELPSPPPLVRSGLPPEPAPTLVHFAREVQVRRGRDLEVDQLDCDELHARLLPSEKKPIAFSPGFATRLPLCWAGTFGGMMGSAAGPLLTGSLIFAPTPPGSGGQKGVSGPLGDLDLRAVQATGHAVWLQSQSQGLKAKGNRLDFTRAANPKEPDVTFFQGGETTRLFVEKSDYKINPKIDPKDPAARQLTSVMTIRATDVTLFDDHVNGPAAAVLATGPGRMEERPARNVPPNRTVIWRDRLESRIHGKDKDLRRVITLFGQPRLEDTESGMIEARDRLYVWLKPRPPSPKPKANPALPLAKTDAKPEEKPANATSRAVLASDGKTVQPVRLLGPQPINPPGASPSSSTSSASLTDPGAAFQIERMQAMNYVRFESPGKSLLARNQIDVVFEEPTRPVTASASASAPASADAKGGKTPAVGADPKQSGAPKVELSGPQAEAVAAKPKAAEPNWRIEADTLWAKLVAAEPGSKAWRLDRSYLRGQVMVHQDPREGKARGLDAGGGAIDIESQGDNRMALRLAAFDPAAGPGSAPSPGALAHVTIEDFAMEGPIIGVDQKDEYAFVKGAGKLTQWGDSDLLGMNKPAKPAAGAGSGAAAKAGANAKADRNAKTVKPAAPGEDQPKVIAWRNRMTFQGRVLDADGQLRPARANFFGGVRGDLGDSTINCEQLDAYMDQAVSFTRAFKMPGETDVAEQRPKIEWVQARDRVVLVNQKVNPVTKVVSEIVRVDGPEVTFDRVTDTFQVNGNGIVRHYKLEKKPANANGNASANANANAQEPPWELTRIAFSEGMQGKVGLGAGGTGLSLGSVRGNANANGNANGTPKAPEPPRQAEFHGEVDLVQARVEEPKYDVNPQDPPANHRRLSSETLVVETLPAPPEFWPKVQSRTLAFATGLPNARTRDVSVQGDEIHYDSLKDTFFIYGQGGRDVIVVRQDQPGQPASYGRTSALQFNPTTNELNLINPRGGMLVDSGTGVRPSPTAPNSGPVSPAAPARPRFPSINRGARDRPGFGDGGLRVMPGTGRSLGGTGTSGTSLP